MVTKKNTQNSGAQSIIQYVLVLLLIVAAFFIGYLWNKVQSLENTPQEDDSAIAAPTAPVEEGNTIDSVLSILDIDRTKVEECIDSGAGEKAVTEDTAAASKIDVRGTPSSFLLDTATGEISRIPGAVPLNQITPVVDQMLAGTFTPTETGVQLPGVEANEPVKGSREAQIMLIEYSDYDCPFCTRFHETAQTLIDTYSGKVAWAYRQFPLDALHPNARAKSEAAECVLQVAGEDAYWQYTDLMLE